MRDTLKLGAGKIMVTGLGAITAIAVYRLMGPVAFGVYGLAGSLVAVFAALDLTGIGISTNTRLAQAVGARDEGEILDLLAAHVKIALALALVLTLLIAVVGVPVARLLHEDATAVQIGQLAFWLGVARIADSLYLVPYNALQSRRAMGAFAALGTLNQTVMAACTILAAAFSQTAESLVVGRLVYSSSTLILAWMLYRRYRAVGDAPPYPPIRAILRRAWTLTFAAYRRRYLGYGMLIAFDKNLANLYIQIPMQIAGSLGGTAAAGYLDLALSAISYAGVITSALLDNLAAVVPQAVGRGDYSALWRNFRRIVLGLTAGGLVVFGAAALLAPIFIPPLLGDEWTPALPALTVLMLYGVITTTGGVFGSLYRALNLLGRAIAAKLIALSVVGIMAVVWVAGGAFAATDAAVVGAWLIVGFYAVSVALMAWWTLRALRWRAASAPR
ncbi:MAG: oligosaccharide flippase family protein [Chloroflexota bacterium]|nr:oligosaccharide flippase family protein [Chloroflexota bacterium]